jgi:hypothetical protein
MVVGLVAVGAVPFGRATAATTVLGPSICARGLASNGNVNVTGGMFQNISGAQMTVICSLFRDNTTNTNGMQDLEITVRNDGDVANVATCTAVSYNRQGSPLKMASRTTNGTSVEQTLDFGGSLNLSVSRGHYSIFCQMPNLFSVHNIFYTEP